MICDYDKRTGSHGEIISKESGGNFTSNVCLHGVWTTDKCNAVQSRTGWREREWGGGGSLCGSITDAPLPSFFPVCCNLYTVFYVHSFFCFVLPSRAGECEWMTSEHLRNCLAKGVDRDVHVQCVVFQPIFPPSHAQFQLSQWQWQCFTAALFPWCRFE